MTDINCSEKKLGFIDLDSRYDEYLVWFQVQHVVCHRYSTGGTSFLRVKKGLCLNGFLRATVYAPQLYRQVLLRRVLAMAILSVRPSVTAGAETTE